MLLILFNGHTEPAVAIAAAMITEPAAGHGYIVDRPATSGEWRLALELGDPFSGEAFSWHDITQFYAGDSYQRGADEYLGRYRAAVAQVQLQTDDDMLAPWGQDTSSLFGSDITLDAGLLMRLGMFRVVSGVVVEWNPLWTGRVETWGDASAARGQIRTHVVTVTDVIADLANVPTIVDTGGGLSFADFLTENGWLFGIDSYGDTDVVIPFDLNPVNAINRMDGGADPFGYVWRSRRTGRLITYPPPWDTTNVARWSNPLLDSYPSGLVFSFSPDFTDIEYIADDDAQPFGIQRTSLGVLNNFIVTTPSTQFVEDDPLSEAHYGVRPYVTTWVAEGVEQVVIDLLDSRAFASAQAQPLRTTLDHEGFWSAMAIVDHLDPVTIIHATTDDGPVVTAPGTIRNVTEDRTVRGVDDDDVRLLSWQSTVQIDITSTTTAPALLPVEDLTFLGGNSPLLGGPSSAQFSWVNPTQPDVTPTEVQLRVLGRSLIWFPKTYPGVGADGVNIGFLSAATTYTLQVRLIRRVAGVIVAFSATRQVTFTTPAIIIPIFVPDGDSTDVIVGEPPDFTDDCVLEVELQENDGTGWTTIESYTQSDLHQNDDGTWSLIYPVPNSTFVNDRIYRFRSREVCGGIDGQWFTGSSFDPPDDWTDPCTTPPALADPPYDDPSLIVYIPQVCQGDEIVEAVSDVAGVQGPAFDGFVQMLDEPDRLALLAIADPGWSDTPGGIIAYGECDQINGATSDKTIGVYTAIANNDAAVLFECANMQITVGPGSGSNWQAGATVTTVDGVLSLISGDIPVGPDGVQIFATYNAATGAFILYVDTVQVDSDTIGHASLTAVALPIWRVGAPPESWVTDCALWSTIVDVTPPPSFPTANLWAWWDASDGATVHATGGRVDQLDDKWTGGRNLTSSGSNRPYWGTRTVGGLDLLDLQGGQYIDRLAAIGFPTGAWTLVVYQIHDVQAANQGLFSVFNTTGADWDNNNAFVLESDGSGNWCSITNGGGHIDAGGAGVMPAGSWAFRGHSGVAGGYRIKQPDGTTGTATITSSGTANGGIMIGTRIDNPMTPNSQYWDGAVGEVLLFDAALSDSDMDLVWAYLVAKWGS